MMFLFNKHRGFTLLELMITLAIAGTAMALVAPLAIDQVSKMQARSEVAELKQQLERWSFLAFAKSCPLVVQFEDVTMQASSPLCQFEREQQFEYVRFPQQTFEFSVSGYTAQTQLEYSELSDDTNTVITIPLDPSIINVTDETETL